jgi:hypothetical protein
MTLSYRHSILKLLCLVILFWQRHAIAIDLIPGEIIAPNPGVKKFLVSYQLSERGDYFKNGSRFRPGTKIESEQIQIRLGTSFDLYSLPAFIYTQLPMGNIQPAGILSKLPGDSGTGDVSFLLAVWPYSNRDTGEYLAVGGYLTLPTGSYDARRSSLNMGANRISSALQVGYQRSLARNLEWMTAVDGVWFGKNDDYGLAHVPLRQQNLYSAQNGLRYFISDRYSLAATHFYTQGGETNLNGLDLNDPISLQRWQITGAANFDFGRVTVQYGRDLETKNGYIETNRLIIRYGTRF